MWQSPAWWSPSAVLQTPNFCRNMQKFRYHGKVSFGVQFEWYCYIARPLKPALCYKNLTDLLYKLSYSQSCVQIVNFLLPCQQGSIRGQFEWHPETVDLENPVWYKNLGCISYTGRVIANFVFKYPNFCWKKTSVKADLPFCKSRPLTRFVSLATEHLW